MISQGRLIGLLIAALFCPVLWWVSIELFKDVMTLKTSMFLLESFYQKNYWYVYYTCQHMSDIIKSYIVHKLNPYINLSKVTKYIVVYETFRMAEYWLFHGSTPIYPLITTISLMFIDVYRHKKYV